jgi:hypothetical protein
MNAITDIVFDPVLSPALLAVLAVAGVLLLGYALYRRARGTLWRALALAALWLALLNPSATSEQRQPLNDVAVVVVDETRSQSVGERLSAARDAGAALTADLEALAGLEVRTAVVDHGAGGDGTRLFAEIARQLADIPPERVAGVVAVTDGQIHDAPEIFEETEWPLHVVLTGARGERDRRISIENAPSYGIVGDRVTVAVRVEDEGSSQASAAIVIRADGQQIGRATARIGEPTEITFDLSHPGISAFEVEVDPGEQELTLENNRAVAVVNGVRDRLRVMLVSGEPNPGLRTWRNLLKADPSVDLVHFTILRPPNKQDMTPVRELSLIPFPTNELFAANLSEFDLIIFDSYHRRGILPMVYLSNVVDYVVEGGAVLDTAGPSFASPLSLAGTPLGTILPGRPTGRVFKEGFRPKITGEGFRHPVTVDLPGGNTLRTAGSDATSAIDAAWGRWFRHIDVDLASGTTLMSGHEQRPLLVLDRIGDGRVAQLLSDHSWLWARGFEGGGPQSNLLRRLVHWLMKEPDLEEEDLSAEVDNGNITVTRRSLEPILDAVEMTLPDGSTRRLMLTDVGSGRATTTVETEISGLYRFDQGTQSAIAVAGVAMGRELEDVRASDTVLAGPVEASGGGLVWMAEDGVPTARRVRAGRDAAGRGWIGFVEQDRHLVTGLEQTPMMPAWLLLLAALGGLMLGWRAEGR